MRMGLGLGLNFQAGAPGGTALPSYDADAQGYFDFVVASGGAAFDTTHKDALNSLVLALKAGGSPIWSLIGDNEVTPEGRLFWFANQHKIAAQVTIANPAFDAEEVNAPVFLADRYYKSDGVSGYLNLNYNPTSVAVDKTNFGFTVYIRTDRTVDATDCVFGGFNGTDAAVQFYPLFPVGVFYTRNHDLLSGVANATTRGIYTCTRNGTNVRTYKNGAEVNNETGAAGTLLNMNLFACAFNNGGVNPGGHSTDEIIMVATHKHFTAGQVAAFHTAIEVCADALGAGVL